MSVRAPNNSHRPSGASARRPGRAKAHRHTAEALRNEYDQRSASQRPLPRSVDRAFQELLARATRNGHNN